MAAEKPQIKEERNKKLQYEKRKSTLLKWGKELSILCDINVCVVVLSPDGKLETWPENLDDVQTAFRDAAASHKRPRSDNNRKRRNSSQVKILPDDDKKTNKKMKAIADGCQEDSAGVLVMGKKTEHPLSSYNCSGNYPTFGEWNNMSFAAGIGDYDYYSNPDNNNYENRVHLHQGCSPSSCAAFVYGSGSEFLGDPGCSSYGGGDCAGHGNQILPYDDHHQWNDNYDSAAGAAMFDPLCVRPLQSIGNQRFGGSFQFGNYYQYE